MEVASSLPGTGCLCRGRRMGVLVRDNYSRSMAAWRPELEDIQRLRLGSGKKN